MTTELRKPKLVPLRQHQHGFTWKCYCIEASGFGRDMKAAYDEWRKITARRMKPLIMIGATDV